MRVFLLIDCCLLKSLKFLFLFYYYYFCIWVGKWRTSMHKEEIYEESEEAIGPSSAIEWIELILKMLLIFEN